MSLKKNEHISALTTVSGIYILRLLVIVTKFYLDLNLIANDIAKIEGVQPLIRELDVVVGKFSFLFYKNKIH